MATTQNVLVYCSTCHCSELIPDGYATKTLSLIGRAGEIIASGFGIKSGASTPTDHCTCHTGIGALTRLGIKVNPSVSA